MVKMASNKPVVMRSIQFTEGCWRAAHRCGAHLPIKLANAPVTSFVRGWYPKILLDLGLDVHLLEFVSESGARATWFLDNEYRHITDNVKRLSPNHLATLEAALLEPLTSIFSNLLVPVRPSTTPEAFYLEFIDDNTIRDIIQLVFPLTVVSPTIMRLQQESQQAPVVRLAEADILLASVSNCFRIKLQEHVDLAMRDGYLTCLSPVDGRELRSQQSLVLHEHRMAFRFTEPEHNFVFYISTTHHLTCIADLYIPAANLVVVDVADDSRISASDVAVDYLTHFITHNQKLGSYLRHGGRIPAVVCRGYPGMHIGHHLWNELTAFDRLSRSMGPDYLPVIIVPNANRGTEAYGPLDALFIEWAGKIDRSLRSEVETLGSFVYRKNYFLARALDQYVTTSLSTRVASFAAETPSTSASRLLMSELKSNGYTIVTIGLRVENRTAVNLYQFLEYLIDYTAGRIEKLAVILDGHNSRLEGNPATAFDSFRQPPDVDPILLELKLAMQLRQRFEYTDVKLLTLIGRSIQDSIVCVSASHFFVTFWGAGLAKYRWVCNKIGLVITSQHNLRSRCDLHIYDSAEFQQEPAPILFIDPDSITDRPDLPVQFPGGLLTEPSYSNFDIALESLGPQLDRLLELCNQQALRG